MIERGYFDAKGTGVLDVMNIFENDVVVTYRLNDFTWKQMDEYPLTEAPLTERDALLRKTYFMLIDRNQIDRSTSNNNKKLNEGFEKKWAENNLEDENPLKDDESESESAAQ